jgi:hypothetical protein
MSATLARRWFQEVWNERRVETIDAMLSKDGLCHGLPGDPRGPTAFRAFHAAFLAKFPDLRVIVDETLEGPPDAAGVITVATRFTASGTHAPSKKAGSFACMSFTRWRGGQCVEAFDVCDFFGLQAQLGCSPF